MVIATGDNILTVISVSIECNSIKNIQEIYYFEIKINKNGKKILKRKKILDSKENKLLDELNKWY